MNCGIASSLSSRSMSALATPHRALRARCAASRLQARPLRLFDTGRTNLDCVGSSRSASLRCLANSSSGGQPFTITTPLYYVNAAPHMGSAYPTIAADVFARYQRLSGHTVRFVTGTDEHGEKIALAAAARGMSPKEHCDAIVQQYKALWSQLDIAYDSFIRTTDPQHEALVSEVLQRVWDKGDIYKAAYSGWYCVDCEEYKDDKEMDAEHNCPTHRRPCQHREEENYFFALSKYQAQLEALLQGNEAFVAPASRRNEVLGWVREGVRDFSISRSAVQWGIPMKQDPSHTVYVWFDALNGYLSGLLPLSDAAISSGRGDSTSSSADASNGSANGSSSSSVDTALAQGWPASVHVIGKDILRFHAIYWPGMLMSAGLPLPRQVFGHGFLTKDGLKMGKALGNTLDPTALVSNYGPDAVRLFFMKEVAFGQDGNFSEQAFRDTVNATLANSVGNMLNRTLGLLRKNCDGSLPCSAHEAAAAGAAAAAAAAGEGEQQQAQQHPLQAACEQQVAAAAAAYSKLAPQAAVEALLGIAAAGNLYLEQTAPWTALKKGSEEEQQAAKQVLVAVLEAARILAVALSPITPGLSSRVYQQLGLSEGPLQGRVTWADTAWGQLQAGHRTAEPQPVFARLDDTVPFVTEVAPTAVPAAGGAKGGKAAAADGSSKKKQKAAAAAAS